MQWIKEKPKIGNLLCEYNIFFLNKNIFSNVMTKILP